MAHHSSLFKYQIFMTDLQCSLEISPSKIDTDDE